MIHTDTAELKEDTPTESYTIYSIVNLENGKRYVGRSQHPKRRIKFHLCNLHTHNHPNPLINKDSNCEFGYEILEEGVPFEDRKEREKTWIFAFKTYDEKHGYNANDPCVKTEPELVRRVKPKYVNEVMVINVEKIK
jgi:group I intron endonuclease